MDPGKFEAAQKKSGDVLQRHNTGDASLVVGSAMTSELELADCFQHSLIWACVAIGIFDALGFRIAASF